ncbi:MAG: EVE domain-containing protein [Chloroflexota bacterium]
MGKTYWMLVTTYENYRITRDLGFSIQGVESKQRRKAVRMGPDDRLLYYISDRQAFAATAVVASEHFEDHTRFWQHHTTAEDFPHRVKIRPEVVLDETRWLDASHIAHRMEYIRKWPPEWWRLAFMGALHIIPQKDFYLLEEEMKKIASAAAAGSRSRAQSRRRNGRRGRPRGDSQQRRREGRRPQQRQAAAAD